MSIGVGTGIYRPREASRLTGLSVRRVKGWLHGYDRGAGPLIGRDPDDGPSLSFLDLIEILFVNSFLEHGVTMSHIREASRKAMDMAGGQTHPFAISRFETDGRKIFARLSATGSKKKHVVGLVDGQFAFDKAIAPFFKQIDYRASGDATRWWPLGKRAPILLDPNIAFGAPVTKTAHVPASAINGALSAGESATRVAKWFEIPLKDVRAAAALERQMAA
ncbi:MAG TPA: DUF433 domain-containing protein [Polyangia bacterium]